MEKLSDRESYLKQDVSKKGLLCVISEIILAESEVLSQLCIPLIVYSSLPVSFIQIGINIYYKPCLLGFWDSHNSINTVNPLLHQCITTRHPHLVEKYEQFYDHNSFKPIKLTCSMDNDDPTKTESMYEKLAMVVTYHTFYI